MVFKLSATTIFRKNPVISFFTTLTQKIEFTLLNQSVDKTLWPLKLDQQSVGEGWK